MICRVTAKKIENGLVLSEIKEIKNSVELEITPI
jgi:hypothetical protein